MEKNQFGRDGGLKRKYSKQRRNSEGEQQKNRIRVLYLK